VGGGPIEFFDEANIPLGPYPPYCLLFLLYAHCDSVFFFSGFGTSHKRDNWDS